MEKENYAIDPLAQKEVKKERAIDLAVTFI